MGGLQPLQCCLPFSPSPLQTPPPTFFSQIFALLASLLGPFLLHSTPLRAPGCPRCLRTESLCSVVDSLCSAPQLLCGWVCDWQGPPPPGLAALRASDGGWPGVAGREGPAMAGRQGVLGRASVARSLFALAPWAGVWPSLSFQPAASSRSCVAGQSGRAVWSCGRQLWCCQVWLCGPRVVTLCMGRLALAGGGEASLGGHGMVTCCGPRWGLAPWTPLRPGHTLLVRKAQNKVRRSKLHSNNPHPCLLMERSSSCRPPRGPWGGAGWVLGQRWGRGVAARGHLGPGISHCFANENHPIMPCRGPVTGCDGQP